MRYWFLENIWFPFKLHILLGGYLGCGIDQWRYLKERATDRMALVALCLSRKIEALKIELREVIK